MNVRTYVIIASLLTFVASAGCVWSKSPHRGRISKIPHSVADGKVNSLLITKFLPDGASAWYIDITDKNWEDMTEEALENKTWGPSTSICTQKQFFEVLSGRIDKFLARRPHARIDSIDFDSANTISDLWLEILKNLKETELKMPGRKIKNYEPIGDNLLDPPEAATDSVCNTIERWGSNTDMLKFLNRYGWRLTSCDGVLVYFKDSLTGRLWSKIAARPDDGIEIPPQMEIDFEDSAKRNAGTK